MFACIINISYFAMSCMMLCLPWSSSEGNKRFPNSHDTSSEVLSYYQSAFGRVAVLCHIHASSSLLLEARTHACCSCLASVVSGTEEALGNQAWDSPHDTEPLALPLQTLLASEAKDGTGPLVSRYTGTRCIRINCDLSFSDTFQFSLPFQKQPPLLYNHPDFFHIHFVLLGRPCLLMSAELLVSYEGELTPGTMSEAMCLFLCVPGLTGCYYFFLQKCTFFLLGNQGVLSWFFSL